MTAPQFIGEIDSDTMGLAGRRGRLRVVHTPRPRFIQNQYDEFDGGYDAANLSGLGKNPLKKLGKGLKKVVKSKAFKVVAGAAAAYYGGGAIKKALKNKGAKGLVKKGAKKASTLSTLKKFGKKHKKALIGAGIVGTAALATGSGGESSPVPNAASNSDIFNPQQKPLAPQESPQSYAQPAPMVETATATPLAPSGQNSAAELFERFTNAQTVRSGGSNYGGETGDQEQGQFAGSIDPKFLMIGAAALLGLFLLGKKRG